MALTKAQKDQEVATIANIIEGVDTIYLSDVSGMSVSEATVLRDRLRKEGASLRVVKNTLLKIALEQSDVEYDGLYEFLEGPTALATSPEPSVVAKVFKQFHKESKGEKPGLKAALVDGSVFRTDQLDVLAALKSRDELLGEIITLLNSPMTNVVSGLQAAGSNLVGAIKAIAEKAEA